MMKPIYYLPLLLVFLVSCSKQNQAPRLLLQPKAKVNESKTTPTPQTPRNIPWIDPSLLVGMQGC